MKQQHFSLIEVNTAVFLSRIRRKYKDPALSLAAVPDKEWKVFKDQGFDYIWLMGVWQRSPAAKQHAIERFRQHGDYRDVLPDLTEVDIAGSAYAVYDYQLDASFGDHADLAAVRTKLSAAGLKLILDFVPNHLALDHPWTVAHPGRFVQKAPGRRAGNRDWFFETPEGKLLGHGRDPYFPPWADTVQVNYFSPDYRHAALHTLCEIAKVCDGVRCDMAMLGLNEIFASVWRGVLEEKEKGKSEFWAEMIQGVRAKNPGFLFMGEVYWDLEPRLQELGFDYTYDKKFYDKVKSAAPQEIHGHLTQKKETLSKGVRFIENHDEERALKAFGKKRSFAAAAMMATLPGMRFFYDGQMEGRKIRVPVQLRREPDEKRDPGALRFYQSLLAYIDFPVLKAGRWKLLKTGGAAGTEQTAQNLLAWEWREKEHWRIMVVNYSPMESCGFVRVDVPEFFVAKRHLRFLDYLHGLVSDFDMRPLCEKGIPLILEPWELRLWIAMDRD